MVRKRALIGIVFSVGGFFALVKTWYARIPIPPNPPQPLIFDSDTLWNFVLTTGIEATVMVIGIWLIASGRNSDSSS